MDPIQYVVPFPFAWILYTMNHLPCVSFLLRFSDTRLLLSDSASTVLHGASPASELREAPASRFSSSPTRGRFDGLGLENGGMQGLPRLGQSFAEHCKNETAEKGSIAWRAWLGTVACISKDAGWEGTRAQGPQAQRPQARSRKSEVRGQKPEARSQRPAETNGGTHGQNI
jgi:hypothetical protein